MPTYASYSVPTFRSSDVKGIKGVSYGPSPLKKQNVLLTDDDFMNEITGALWADWGRGDLKVIQDLGANAMRMYGNDPNHTKRTFLDAALEKNIDIIAGMSDYPYIQGPDPCMRNDWNCYDQVYENYRTSLLHGFTLTGKNTYHPALKALILINEPDLKVHPRSKTCRAVASAFDAVLQAEKDVGVTGNPIALTATFSFAMFDPKTGPGLGQMIDFYNCIKKPEAAPTSYTPKNDLLAAYKARWVNSFNTANPAPSVKQLFLDKYAATFWNEEIKMPVFIGEYHSTHVPVAPDVKEIVAATLSTTYPFFLGVSFFEFSTRYDKGGTEETFGMFGYGDCALSSMNYSSKVYNVWDLTPKADPNKAGETIHEAVRVAYGGTSDPVLRTAPCVTPTEE